MYRCEVFPNAQAGRTWETVHAAEKFYGRQKTVVNN